MTYLPQNRHQWIGFIAYFFMHALLEYWLGKTKKIQAASVLEVIGLLSLAIGAAITVKLVEKFSKKGDSQNVS